MPTPTELQFDGRLTNISIQYRNPEYIADLVVPPTPVPKKTGKFKKYTKPERFTVPSTLVGPKSVPNEVEWSTEEGTFTCKDYGLEEFVSEEEVANADVPIQPMSDATDFVTDLVLLDKEKRVADAVFDTNNYGASNQTDIAGGWATLSDDALTDIEVGIDACFAPPNVMAMGIATWRKLARNEKILAAVKGTLKPQALKTGSVAVPAAVNQQELAEHLGLDAVLVGRARINTAKKGQTASYARVWDGPNTGKGGAALLRVKANAGTRDVISASQFAWKQRQVFRYASTRGAYGGTTIRVVESLVLKVICTDVGYLFVDCLAD